MQGFVPETNVYYSHLNDASRSYYLPTSDIDLLMHPEAVLCDTTEELEAELKKRHPDVEEGYGQVIRSIVYHTPGLITHDHETAERVCKKYGKIPNHIGFRPDGLNGFIADHLSIRYDEKIKKNREKAKSKPTKRNSVYIKHIIQLLSACEYDSKHPMIKQCLKTCHINLGTNVSAHARSLFLAELIMAATDNGKAMDCGNFRGLQEDWAKSVTDPRLVDYHALKTIEILNTIFSRKETLANLAG